MEKLVTSPYKKVLFSKSLFKLAVAVFVVVANYSLRAQDHVVAFKTSDVGVNAAITNWGYDTGWNDLNNIQRSIIFMGTNVVNAVRVIAAESSAMNNGSSIWNSTLSTADQNYLSNMVNEIRGYTPTAKWYIHCDGGITNWYSSGSGHSFQIAMPPCGMLI